MKFKERERESLFFQTRFVTKFLFLPKTLVRNCTGKLQTRWLERARIVQEFIGWWEDIEWAD